mmetsp:Transcript_37374/g.87410  ORF Transcript_37374/g.87410 Transcript_37374/m.87410 type:complete len:218 (-) Transcript_37374:784-1437(-)
MRSSMSSSSSSPGRTCSSASSTATRNLWCNCSSLLSLPISSSANLPSSRNRLSAVSWWKRVNRTDEQCSSCCRCALRRSPDPLLKAGNGAGAVPTIGKSVLKPLMSTNRSQLAPLHCSAASRTFSAPCEANRRSLIVRIISSIPSALRKSSLFASGASAEAMQSNVFSTSSASSASCGSLRLYCAAAVSKLRIPSTCPRKSWLGEFCCSSTARSSDA